MLKNCIICGKGIKVCNKWRIFENFKQDIYKSYKKHIKLFGEKNTQIDRIDNDKGYYKENCRWTTIKGQARNKKNSLHFIAISPDGENHYFQSTLDIQNKFNLPSKSVYDCLTQNRQPVRGKCSGWKFKLTR